MRSLNQILWGELQPQESLWFGGQNIELGRGRFPLKCQMLILPIFGSTTLNKSFNVNLSHLQHGDNFLEVLLWQKKIICFVYVRTQWVVSIIINHALIKLLLWETIELYSK